MSDIQSLVLYNMLKNPVESLKIWPKLKPYFFNSDFSNLYLAISKHYTKYRALPSFADLNYTIRDSNLLNKISALETLEVEEEIDNLVALEAITDQYTQNEALAQISSFIDKVPVYDSSEIKEKLTEIVLLLEERTNISEEICTMNTIMLMDEEEKHNKVPLGLNNSFDNNVGGIAITELVMLGGTRGSGKTIAACNLSVNQYEQGNIGLFFSIEMRTREIFNRFISLLADVDSGKIRRMECDAVDLLKIARVRTDMFVDGEELYQDFTKHNDYNKFELDLLSSKKLKQDGQLIIVDNQFLTMADIDINIQKFKAIHGDRLKMVVVDYVNQIHIPDMYNWQTQVSLSKGLKNIARKHDVIMVTPYQIDAHGEARFAKGLLDAADIAATLKAEEHHITFTSTKTRNIPPFEFHAPVNWDSLKISPHDAVVAAKEEDEPKPKKGKVSEKPQDIPF